MKKEEVICRCLQLTKEAIEINNLTKCGIDVNFSCIGGWAEFVICNSKAARSDMAIHTVTFSSYNVIEELDKIEDAFEFIKQHGIYVDIDEFLI